jgi:hypothetical protein
MDKKNKNLRAKLSSSFFKEEKIETQFRNAFWRNDNSLTPSFILVEILNCNFLVDYIFKKMVG